MATIDEVLSLLRALRLPRCARCRQPVERVDFDDDRYVAGHVLTAHCHGARERIWLTDDELRAIVLPSLRVLPAFSPGSVGVLDPRDCGFREPRPYGAPEVPRYEPRGAEYELPGWRSIRVPLGAFRTR